ncbi:unnamed protein product, partial [Brenthis ino]
MHFVAVAAQKHLAEAFIHGECYCTHNTRQRVIIIYINYYIVLLSVELFNKEVRMRTVVLLKELKLGSHESISEDKAGVLFTKT